SWSWSGGCRRLYEEVHFSEVPFQFQLATEPPQVHARCVLRYLYRGNLTAMLHQELITCCAILVWLLLSSTSTISAYKAKTPSSNGQTVTVVKESPQHQEVVEYEHSAEPKVTSIKTG